ncbi:MAG: ABC transporter ATP-binding protein [Oligosphaeraceae bacterium]|nr:ABC transporter ATP-binding protein [Oligosphaeraceae bacterium]
MQITPGNSTLGNLRKILVFMWPYRRHLFGLMTMTACLAVLAIFPPLVTKALIDRVFTRGDVSVFFLFGALMVLIPTISHLLSLFQQVLSVWLGQRFVFDVRFKLYQHMLRLSLRFFNKHSVGKLVNRLMGDSGTVQQMLTGQSMTVLSDLIVASCAILATFLISWRMASVLIIIIFFFVINFKFSRKRIVDTSRAMRKSYDRLSGGVQNRLVANLAVKTFGAEQRENLVFAEQSEETIFYGKEQGIAGNNFWMNVSLIRALGDSIIYFIGCAMVLQGSLSYGEVVAFCAYGTQLLWPAVRFSQLANQLQQVSIATERLFEIFDEVPEIQNDPEAVFLPRLSGKVDFQDVRFHYEPGKEIIKGFSLQVKPGDRIALIGPTGCGKSTILNLIIRYYDITGGSLTLDDVPIHKLDLRQLRRQFGIVLQESHLFSTSIKENIRYSRPNASDDEVMEAARTAEIHDFIMTLPEGYDTAVGDFGVELSVGQKQRINIARAICAKPAILIMDEATSSLDSDSEQAIQKAMEKVLSGRTSFVVAHRLSTIKNSNKIILLDKGHIQEQGTHEELMAMPKGRYRELYTKHMGAGVLAE